MNALDSISDQSDSRSVLEQIDKTCVQLEQLVVEWGLESAMNDEKNTDIHRCLVADHSMSIYTIIIGLRRQAKVLPTDTITVRVARKVVHTLLNFIHSKPDRPIACYIQ